MFQIRFAYLAGIIDGEGCISIRHTYDKHFGVVLRVGNTEKKLMTWLQKEFGGSYHAATRKTKSGKIAYQWTTSSGRAVSILERILPYLLLKKEQAKIALKFQSLLNTNHSPIKPSVTNIRKREQLIKRLQKLKSRNS